MKKKFLVGTVAACLAAVTVVGGTLAYFQDSTREVVNTFTIGNVHIDLLEPGWEPEKGKHLEPGAVVDKNPFIMNTGMNDGYMMIHVDGMAEMADQGFEVEYNETDWDLVDASGKKLNPTTNQLQDGYYVYNKGAVKADGKTSALFEKVKFSEKATEVNSPNYKIMGYFTDKDGKLFTYEDANGVEIPENVGKQPQLDSEGNPIVVYKINGVDSSVVFGTAAEAEDYVLTRCSNQKVGFKFDLTLQGFAIQTEKDKDGKDIGFDPYTKWVPKLTGQKPALD